MKPAPLLALLPVLALLPALALLSTLATAGELDLGPPITPPPTPPGADCMAVQVGNTLSYGCLDQQQRALVARHRAGLAASALTASSPAPALGLFNRTATQQRLGVNFGKSAFPPPRPPAVYNAPLGPR